MFDMINSVLCFLLLLRSTSWPWMQSAAWFTALGISTYLYFSQRGIQSWKLWSREMCLVSACRFVIIAAAPGIISGMHLTTDGSE